MKASELTGAAIYAHQARRHGPYTPALLLDTAACRRTVRIVGTVPDLRQVTEIVPSAKMRAEKGESAGVVGIPILRIEHDAYRWMPTEEPSEERIATPAWSILEKAILQFGSRSLFGTFEFGQEPPSRMEIVAVNGRGKKISVGVLFELARPQSLVEAWAPLLKRLTAERDEALARARTGQQQAVAADLLDVQVAERLDALLGEEERATWNGQRIDVQRQRGGEVFHVDTRTLLRLLDVAEDRVRVPE